MADIKTLFQQLNASISELTGQIHALDDQIEAKTRERDGILSAPLSKDDYLSFLGREIDTYGQMHAKNLREVVQKDPRNMVQLERDIQSQYGLNIPYLRAGYPYGDAISPWAVFWYFGDLIKQRIGDALDGMVWPQDAMPMAERKIRVSQLEAKIADLNSQRDALAAQLEGAGLKG